MDHPALITERKQNLDSTAYLKKNERFPCGQLVVFRKSNQVRDAQVTQMERKTRAPGSRIFYPEP